MPIRLQADADFNQIIVSAVARRYQEIDIRTATAAGLKVSRRQKYWPLPGTTAPSSSHMTTRRCQGTSKSSSGQRGERDSSSSLRVSRFEKSSMLSI